MLSTIDSPPPASPMQRRGVIEIDTFCTGCFYNLHGQVVSIDPRLGFPVCRCPECGKFHPAGTGVTASGIWLRRFASLLLFIWISAVVAGLFGILGVMVSLDAASVGMYGYNYQATADGQPVTFSPGAKGGGSFITGTQIPAPQVRSFLALHPWYLVNTQYDAGLASMVLLSAGSLALGFVTATLWVSLLWHWPKRRYAWALLAAILPAALVTVPFRTDDTFQFIRAQCLEHIVSQMGFQIAGLLLGIFLGRSVSRLIVRMVIPPKPRQALAFLWMVDGKAPPDAGNKLFT